MFASLITHRARVQPRSPATYWPAGPISFERFDGQVNSVAAALAPVIPHKQALVAIQVGQPLRHWLLTLALARLGHVSFFTKTDRWQADLVLSEAADDPLPGAIVLDRDWWSAALHRPPVPVAEVAGWDDPARVIFSSGTTGRPKGLMFTHRMILQRSGNGVLGNASGAPLASQTRMLVSMGLGSLGGFTPPITIWGAGGSVIMSGGIKATYENVVKYGINLLVVSPTQLRSLLEQVPADVGPDPRLSITVGGGLLTTAQSKEAQARLTPNIIVSYGSTEASTVTAARVDLMNTENNEVGYTVPWVTVEIVDHDDQPLPPGQEGQIRMRGMDLITRYEDDAEATSKAFRGGWYYPGDVGSLSSTGVLRVTGRVDELINVGGVKRAPDLLDEQMRAAEGVIDAACVAIVAADGGQDIHFAVVVGDRVDVDRLARRFSFGRPIHVHRVDEIPRNDMGKVQREKLRSLIAELTAKPADTSSG